MMITTRKSPKVRPFLGLCLYLLVACGASAAPSPVHPSKMREPDAATQQFFKRLHYPYIASNACRLRIEHAAKEMRLGQTKAQVLAQLGPPDWKEEVAGHLPEVPPAQAWY